MFLQNNFTNLPIENATSIILLNEKNKQTQRVHLTEGFKKLYKSLDFTEKKSFLVYWQNVNEGVGCYK